MNLTPNSRMESVKFVDFLQPKLGTFVGRRVIFEIMIFPLLSDLAENICQCTAEPWQNWDLN